MASDQDRLIVILGSGPGIGVGVASYFASQSFSKVALLSRNASRLLNDAASVKSIAKSARGVDVTVKTYPVDLLEPEKVETVLKQVVQELGKPEVVVYNAARVGGGKFFQVEESVVLSDFTIATLSMYTAARVLMPHLQSQVGPGRNPAFLVTSGGLYKQPYHGYFSLSLSKAAQFNLTQSLAQAFARNGVHVAAVVVHGLVNPENEYVSPQKIASVFWDLYRQGPKGEREVWVVDKSKI